MKYKSWVINGLRLYFHVTSVSLSYSCIPGNNFEANPFILDIIKPRDGLEESNVVKPERLLLYSCFCCVVKYTLLAAHSSKAKRFIPRDLAMLIHVAWIYVAGFGAAAE